MNKIITLEEFDLNFDKMVRHENTGRMEGIQGCMSPPFSHWIEDYLLPLTPPSLPLPEQADEPHETAVSQISSPQAHHELGVAAKAVHCKILCSKS